MFKLFLFLFLSFAHPNVFAEFEIPETTVSDLDSETSLNDDFTFENMGSAMTGSFAVCIPSKKYPGYYYIYFCSKPTHNPNHDCTYSTMSRRCP